MAMPRSQRICMLRVSHYAHFIFHILSSPLPPFYQPEAITKRLLLTLNGSWFGLSFGSAVLPISLLFLLSFFLLWQLRKFCATAIFVYCVMRFARSKGCEKCKGNDIGMQSHGAQVTQLQFALNI